MRKLLYPFLNPPANPLLFKLSSLWHQVQAQLGAAVLASDQLRMSQGRQLWSLARGPRDVLHGLRLQLALLERDFDELDYDALRALDPDNPPDVRAFSEVGDVAVSRALDASG